MCFLAHTGACAPFLSSKAFSNSSKGPEDTVNDSNCNSQPFFFFCSHNGNIMQSTGHVQKMGGGGEEAHTVHFYLKNNFCGK